MSGKWKVAIYMRVGHASSLKDERVTPVLEDIYALGVQHFLRRDLERLMRSKENTPMW